MSDFSENITPIHFYCVWLGFQLTTIFLFQLRNLKELDLLQGQRTTAYFFALLAINNLEIRVTQMVKPEPEPEPVLGQVNTVWEYYRMQKIRKCR